MAGEDRTGRRVLVCGGRHFSNIGLLNSTLDAEHALCPIALLIHGDAPGADGLAKQWAFANRVQPCGYPANWKGYDRAAGPIRNAAMLAFAKPDVVIAFPGNRGTANMISQALRAGVRVIRVDPAGRDKVSTMSKSGETELDNTRERLEGQ